MQEDIISPTEDTASTSIEGKVTCEYSFIYLFVSNNFPIFESFHDL